MMKEISTVMVDADLLDEIMYSADEPLCVPERVTLENGRWYRFNGEYKKSVTTALNVISGGSFMDKYYGNAPSYEFVQKKMKKKQDIGSHCHTHIAKLIMGLELNPEDIPPEEIKYVFSFVQFWKQHSTIKPIRVRLVECPLWGGDAWNFAGTLDAVLDIWDEKKGKYATVLLDWKTGQVWTTYKYQLPFYKRLLLKNFPDMHIDEMWDVYLKDFKAKIIPGVDDKPKYEIKKIKDINDEKIRLIDELWEENIGTKPKEQIQYNNNIKLDVEKLLNTDDEFEIDFEEE